MADLRISQLPPLTKVGASATDLVPIADVSASETKKITLKDLAAAGIDLVDAGEIDLAKLDQTSTTKLGTGAFADGSVTAAVLAEDSAAAVAGVAPATGNYRGRGWFNSGTGNLQIWNGAAFQQVVLPTAGIGIEAVTTDRLAPLCVTTDKCSPLGSAAYAAGSVGAQALANESVTPEKIPVGSIPGDRMAPGAIGTPALANAGVTYQKFQNLSSTDLLLGRASEGAGTVEEIPLTAAGRALLADVSAAEQRETLGLGTLAVADGEWANGSSFSGTSSGVNTGDQIITLTGDVVGSGTGTFEATIADSAITEPKYAAASIPTSALQDGVVTATLLADQSSSVVSNANPLGDGAFIGQQWLNASTGIEFTWIGDEWLQHNAMQLVADSVPSLDASKITTGEFPTERLANSGVTGPKLANYSVAKLGEVLPTADYISQLHFNPINKTFFLWDGNVWQPLGISVGEAIFAGTYDANLNEIDNLTSEGAALGLTVGVALPAAAAANSSYYLVVSKGGTGTAPAPVQALAPPDIILSTGSEWVEIDVSSGYTTQTASNVAFTATAGISATTVQAAIVEVSGDVTAVETVANAALARAGGTLTGQLLIGTTGSLVFEGSVDDAFETTLAVVNPTADRTVTIPNETGTVVTTGSLGAVTNAMVSSNAAIALSKLANGALPTGITVASTNIVNGTIVDADINASAAIAGTKVTPNFGDQAISTTDFIAGSRVNVLGEMAPQTGIFRPSTDILGMSAGSREGLRLLGSGGVRQFSTTSTPTAGQFSSAHSAGTVNNLITGSYSALSFSDLGTTSFVVRTNGNVLNANNSYGSLSDAKLKENIVDAGSQWEDIKALRIRKYNFKQGQRHKQLGVIAQEVEKFCPGLVSTSPDRDAEGNDLGTVTKAVNYSVLYLKAVKALQEAMARIEKLEASVA